MSASAAHTAVSGACRTPFPFSSENQATVGSGGGGNTVRSRALDRLAAHATYYVVDGRYTSLDVSTVKAYEYRECSNTRRNCIIRISFAFAFRMKTLIRN